MSTRKALIIGAPDEEIPGVNIDIKNLREYFKSPIGGYWYDSEIKTLISPTENEILREVEMLKVSDYSLIFFAGHGFHSIDRNKSILNINAHQKLDSSVLRAGAEKHTLILDCCRVEVREKSLLKSAMEAATLDFVNGQSPNSSKCRKYFDKAISGCDKGIVVMNSCAINEAAGDSDSIGGYYTYSLIDSANAWARKQLCHIDLTRDFVTWSTRDCHYDAASQVKVLSGRRQNPTFESPRVEKKFPFAVVA